MDICNVGNRVVNTYVYRTGAGFVMVDTGYEHSFGAVVRGLDRRGIPLSEIRYVFLTHAHDDHAGFLNELLSKCPHIRVIISGKAWPALLRGQNSFAGGCSGPGAYAFCRFMGLLGKGRHLFPAIEKQYFDRFIEITPQNRRSIEAALEGRVLFTPGHTADSISLRVGDIIFCGDAAMNGIPSAHRITIWLEDRADFRRSWDVLLAEHVRLLYPAHGRPFPPRDLERYRDRILKTRLYALKS